MRDLQSQFDRLWREHEPALKAIARRIVIDPELRADLLQDARIKAWRFFESFEDDQSFRNWIAKILTRCYLDYQRHTRRRPYTVSFQDRVSLEADFVFEDVVPEIGPTLEERTVSQFHAEKMLDVYAWRGDRFLIEALAQELSYIEIAEVLGCPVGTVRSRINRMRNRLAEDCGPFLLSPPSLATMGVQT